MDAHAKEAAAAVAGIADTYGWSPAPGDIVQCEPPFVGGIATGIVRAVKPAYCLVSIGEDTLAYYPKDLRWTGQRAVEPCCPVEPLTTPAKPGSHNAAAARRAGCEDAYDNAMQDRYGEGW